MSKKSQTNSKNTAEKLLLFSTKYKWLLIVIFLVSISINFYLFFFSVSDNHSDNSQENVYPLLSRRIFGQNTNDLIINFVPLRKAIKDYVYNQKGDVGVYFEYLPSGISIGANDTTEIKLASLSKVPLAMSVMKKIENKKLSLDDKLTIKKEELDKGFGNLWEKGEGATFTVKELLEYSLKSSDNTAYNVLFDALTAEEVMDVYDNLDVEVNSKGTVPIVSPKSYSSIFRSLYLSSYLSNENSNFILDILANSNFKDKIPAGVPSNITVAHKIGVYDLSEVDGKVYSDCGIVYFPKRPYTLCIFVKNSDDEAKKHMAYISHIIYTYLLIVKGDKE